MRDDLVPEPAGVGEAVQQQDRGPLPGDRDADFDAVHPQHVSPWVVTIGYQKTVGNSQAVAKTALSRQVVSPR
ncbi:hypothetical protein GCM10027258_76820 [Amycolatopsis stemonae]